MSTFSNNNGPDYGNGNFMELQRQLLVLESKLAALTTTVGTKVTAADITTAVSAHNTAAMAPSPPHTPLTSDYTTKISTHNRDDDDTAHSKIRGKITDEVTRATTREGELSTDTATLKSDIRKALGLLNPLAANMDIDVGKIRSYDINLKPLSNINPCTSNTAIAGFLYTADSTDFVSGEPKPITNWNDCKPAIFMLYNDTTHGGNLSGFRATVIAVQSQLFVVYEKPTSISRVEFAMYKWSNTGHPLGIESNYALGVTFYNTAGSPITAGTTMHVTAINGFGLERDQIQSLSSYTIVDGSRVSGTDDHGILPEADGVVDVDIVVSDDINKTGVLSFVGSPTNLHTDLTLAYNGIGSVRFQYSSPVGTSGPIIRVPLSGLKQNKIDGSSIYLYSGYFIVASKLSDSNDTIKQMRKIAFTVTPTAVSLTATPLIDYDVDKIEFRLGAGKVWTDEDWALTSTKLDAAYDRLYEALDARGSFFFRVRGPDKTIYFHTDRVYKDESEPNNSSIKFEAEAVLDQAACALNIWRTQNGDTNISGGFLTMATSPNQHADSYSSNKFLDGSGNGVAVTDPAEELLTIGNDKSAIDIVTLDGKRAKMNGKSIATLDDLGTADWAGTFDYRLNGPVELPPDPPATMTGRVEPDIESYALVGTLTSRQFKEYKFRGTAPRGWFESDRVIEVPETNGLFAFIYFAGATSTVNTRFLNVIQTKMYEFNIPVGGTPGPGVSGNDIGTIPDDADPLNPNLGMPSSVPVNEITAVTPNGAVVEGMIVFDKYGTIGYISSIGTSNIATIITLTNTDANLPQSYAQLNNMYTLSTVIGESRQTFTKDDLESLHATGAVVEGMIISDKNGTLGVIWTFDATDPNTFSVVTIASSPTDLTANDVYKAHTTETHLPLPGEDAVWFPEGLFERISGSILVNGCLVFDSWATVGIVTDIELTPSPQVRIQGITHSTDGTAVFEYDGELPIDLGTVVANIPESQFVAKVISMPNIRLGAVVYDKNGSLALISRISPDFAPNRLIDVCVISANSTPAAITLKTGKTLPTSVGTVGTIIIAEDIEDYTTAHVKDYTKGILVADKYGTLGYIYSTYNPTNPELGVKVFYVTPEPKMSVAVAKAGTLLRANVDSLTNNILKANVDLLSGEWILGTIVYDRNGTQGIVIGWTESTINVRTTKVGDFGYVRIHNSFVIPPHFGDEFSDNYSSTDADHEIGSTMHPGTIIIDRDGTRAVVTAYNPVNDEFTARTISVADDAVCLMTNPAITLPKVLNQQSNELYVGANLVVFQGAISMGSIVHDTEGTIGVVTALVYGGTYNDTLMYFKATTVHVDKDSDTQDNQHYSLLTVGTLPHAIGDTFTTEKNNFTNKISDIVGDVVLGSLVSDSAGTVGVITAVVDATVTGVSIAIDTDTDTHAYIEMAGDNIIASTLFGDTVEDSYNNMDHTTQIGVMAPGMLVIDKNGTRAVVTAYNAPSVTMRVVSVPLPANIINQEVGYTNVTLNNTIGGAGKAIPTSSITYVGTGTMTVVKLGDVICDNYGNIGIVTILGVNVTVVTIMHTEENNSVSSCRIEIEGAVGSTINLDKSDVFLISGKRIAVGTLVYDGLGNYATVTSVLDAYYAVIKIVDVPLPTTCGYINDPTVALSNAVNNYVTIDKAKVLDFAGNVGSVVGIHSIVSDTFGTIGVIKSDTGTGWAIYTIYSSHEHNTYGYISDPTVKLFDTFDDMAQVLKTSVTGVTHDGMTDTPGIGMSVVDTQGTCGIIRNESTLYWGIDTVSLDGMAARGLCGIKSPAALSTTIFATTDIAETSIDYIFAQRHYRPIVGSQLIDTAGTVGVVIAIGGTVFTVKTITAVGSGGGGTGSGSVGILEGVSLAQVIDGNLTTDFSNVRIVTGLREKGMLVWDVTTGATGVVDIVNPDGSGTGPCQIKTVHMDIGSGGGSSDNQHLCTFGPEFETPIGSTLSILKSDLVNVISGVAGDAIVGSLVRDFIGALGIVTSVTETQFIVTVLTENVGSSIGYLTTQSLSTIKLGTVTVNRANVAVKNGKYEIGMLVWDATTGATGLVTDMLDVPATLIITTMHVDKDNEFLLRSDTDISGDVDGSLYIPRDNIQVIVPTGGDKNTVTIGATIYDRKGNVGIITSVGDGDWGVRKIATADSNTQDNHHYALKVAGELFPKTIATQFSSAVSAFVNQITDVQGDIVVGSLVSDGDGTVGVVTSIEGLIAFGIVISIDRDVDTLISVGYISDLNYRLISVPGSLTTTIPSSVITLANPATMVVGPGTIVHDAYNADGIITAIEPSGITIMTVAVNQSTNILYGSPSDKLLSPKDDGTVINYGQQITAVPIADLQRDWTGNLVQGGLVYDKNGSIATIVSMSTTTVTLGMVHTNDSKFATSVGLNRTVGATENIPMSMIKVQPGDTEDYQIGMLVSDGKGCIGRIVTFSVDVVTVVTIYVATQAMSIATTADDLLPVSTEAIQVRIDTDRINMFPGNKLTVGTLVFGESNGGIGIVIGINDTTVNVALVMNRHHAMTFGTTGVLSKTIDGKVTDISIGDLRSHAPFNEDMSVESVLGAFVYDGEGTIGIIESVDSNKDCTIRTISVAEGGATYGTIIHDVYAAQIVGMSKVFNVDDIQMVEGGPTNPNVGSLLTDAANMLVYVTEVVSQTQIRGMTVGSVAVETEFDAVSSWGTINSHQGGVPTGNFIELCSAVNTNTQADTHTNRMDLKFSAEVHQGDVVNTIDNLSEETVLHKFTGTFVSNADTGDTFAPTPTVCGWHASDLIPGRYAVSMTRSNDDTRDDGCVLYMDTANLMNSTFGVVSTQGASFSTPFGGRINQTVVGSISNIKITEAGPIPTPPVTDGAIKNLWWAFRIQYGSGTVIWE